MKRYGDGSSWHDSGQAFDIAGGLVESSPEARQWLMDNASTYGLAGLDEYAKPSANATGGHIHFSDHGEEVTPQVVNGDPFKSAAFQKKKNIKFKFLKMLFVKELKAELQKILILKLI